MVEWLGLGDAKESWGCVDYEDDLLNGIGMSREGSYSCRGGVNGPFAPLKFLWYVLDAK